MADAEGRHEIKCRQAGKRCGETKHSMMDCSLRERYNPIHTVTRRGGLVKESGELQSQTELARAKRKHVVC
jgi:hypothetical protein